MRVPDAGDIVRIWEEGVRASRTQRSVSLLAAAFPDHGPADLIDISVGRRDAWLIVLRQMLLGNKASGQAVCPQCAEKVVFDFDVSAFRLEDDKEGHHLSIDGYEIEYRPITVRDLLQLSRMPDIESAKRSLVQAAVLTARLSGQEVAVEDLPDDVVAVIGEAVRERDPQSEVRIKLACPSCERQWNVAFDIASFLYKELSVQAQRNLQEINLLARAYGWSEKEILSLTSTRRRAYLQMAER